MENYYSILGVEKNATSQEIRSAYRKLALKYHPDVNSSADANEKFLKINRAYQVLIDPNKRRRYDMRLSNKASVAYRQWYRQYYEEVRRERAREKYRRKQAYYVKQKKKAKFRYTKRQLWITWMFSVFAALFGTLIIIDYFLPVSWNQEKVISITTTLMSSHELYPSSYMIHTPQTDFPVEGRSNKKFFPYENTKIFVGKTPLLHIQRFIKFTRNKKQILLDVYYSVYDVFAVFLIVMVSTSFFVIFYRKDKDLIFNFGLLNLLLMILMLALI